MVAFFAVSFGAKGAKGKWYGVDIGNDIARPGIDDAAAFAVSQAFDVAGGAFEDEFAECCFAFADDDDVDAVELEDFFGEGGRVKAAHDNEGARFFGNSGQALGLVEGTGHGGYADEVYFLFFKEGTEAVEYAVVVKVLGHNEGFDVVLDGGSEVADGNAVCDETGKWYDYGLGGLNETEMVKVCHKFLCLFCA